MVLQTILRRALAREEIRLGHDACAQHQPANFPVHFANLNYNYCHHEYDQLNTSTGSYSCFLRAAKLNSGISTAKKALKCGIRRI